MIKWKKYVCLLLGMLFLAGCMNGCGKDDGNQRQNENKEEYLVHKKEECGTKHTHEPLTITCYNNLVTEDFLETFHKKYPEVKLDLQRYSGINGSGYAMYSLEHGDIPDIYVSTQNFNKEAQEKYLLDLSNYDFINNYSTSLLDTMDVNGSIYMLPSGYQLSGIYYNRTILEENNWQVPGSFRELTALAKKIEAAGYQTFGHGMSLDGFPFNYFFNIGNTEYFGTPKGTEWKEQFPKGEVRAAGNGSLKKTAAYFKKWVDKGFITCRHMDTASFYEGESVFFLCLGLTEFTHTAKNAKTYEFGIMPWLSMDGSNNMLTRNVSRYFGLNNALSEEGNEQKLEDALKFIDFCSTIEGQQALMGENNYYMMSINEGEIPEDSPYQEVVDLVNEGRTVPMLYVGWEQLVVPIARNIKQLIEKKTDVDGLLESFDKTNEDLLNGSSENIYAVAEETLTLEQTAQLAAAAMGEAVDADCAVISLNEVHGDKKYNNQGAAWYIYEGNIDADTVNLIRPRSAVISTLELTGAQIKEMMEKGLDLDEDGDPYTYLLMTKDGMELEDSTVYKTAAAADDLPQELRTLASETKVSPADAIRDYLKELGTIKADMIRWNP